MSAAFIWLLCLLAAWQAVDTWFNGSLFQRARVAALRCSRSPQRGYALLGELLTCAYCLSHHAPWLTMLAALLLYALGGSSLALFVVGSLAATRVITLADSLLPERAQLDAYGIADEHDDTDDTAG